MGYSARHFAAAEPWRFSIIAHALLEILLVLFHNEVVSLAISVLEVEVEEATLWSSHPRHHRGRPGLQKHA
jgi:hypothetical protein